MTMEAIFKAIDEMTPVLKQIEANTKRMEKQTADSTSSMIKYFKGVFTVTAVTAFAKGLLDTADAVIKLSDKTGIAIEPLQRLKYIAEQSGNSVDQIAGAVTRLQVNLASGDKGAIKAVDALGLSLSGLSAMSPDQQFMAIAREVAKIEDPMERARVATELFGKAGAQLLPTLIADVDELGRQAPVMSEKATRAFDDIGDAINRAYVTAKTWVGEGIGAMIDGFSRLGRSAGALVTGEFARFTRVMMDVDDLNFPKLPKALNAIVPPAKGVAMSMEDIDKVGKHLDRTFKDNEKSSRATAKAYDEVQEKAKAAAAATKAFQESVDFFGMRLDAFNHNALQPYAVGLSDAAAKADILEATLAPLASTSVVATRAMEGAQFATAQYAQAAVVADTTTKTATVSTVKWTGRVGELAQSFAQMAQVSSGALGVVAGGIAKVLTSLDAGIKGVKGMISGFVQLGSGDMIGGIMNLASGVMGVFGAVSNVVKGWFGVSEKVQQARIEVDAFQVKLAETLSATQRAEAGGEQWKMTVIAVRDAFLATGRSAASAEAIVKQLWDTDHPDKARAAMELITGVLAEHKALIGDMALGLSADVVDAADAARDAIESIPTDIDFNVIGRYHPPDIPNAGISDNGVEFGGHMARGGDFLVKSPTMFIAGEGGPERATFTPMGQGGGGDDSRFALMEQFIGDFPRQLRTALHDALVLAPRRV